MAGGLEPSGRSPAIAPELPDIPGQQSRGEAEPEQRGPVPALGGFPSGAGSLPGPDPSAWAELQ